MPTTAEISTAADLRVEIVAELLDTATQSQVIEDVTNALEWRGSSIERDVCRTIHATARFNFGRALDWQSARLRVGMRLTNQITGDTATNHFGVFSLVTPAEVADGSALNWQVDAYDNLTALDTPIARSWAIDRGDSVSHSFTQLISAAESGLTVSTPPLDVASPNARVWPIDSDTTYLAVANDLVQLAGWRPIWAAADGRITTAQWIDPQTLPPAADFNAGATDTTMAAGATLTTDTWAIPNQWVVINDNAEAANAPSATEGIVTVRNEGNGPTSILERGRVINRIERVAAADQNALIAIANRLATEDRLPAITAKFRATPNPILWHRDVINLRLPAIGIQNRKAIVTKWRMPLDGSDMDIEAELI